MEVPPWTFSTEIAMPTPAGSVKTLQASHSPCPAPGGPQGGMFDFSYRYGSGRRYKVHTSRERNSAGRGDSGRYRYTGWIHCAPGLLPRRPLALSSCSAATLASHNSFPSRTRRGGLERNPLFDKKSSKPFFLGPFLVGALGSRLFILNLFYRCSAPEFPYFDREVPYQTRALSGGF